ncbi:MAG: tetratricopeptide repeat protein [Desulfobacterales bacterium]|nr:tetratricopeptide repeat protein [Desulfobacterales bacterium]
MKIKTLPYVSWLFVFCFVCACGGAPRKATEAPAIAQDGAKQIQKGNQLYVKGCYRQAATHFFRAHVHFTAADDLTGVAISLNSLGNIYQANGDADNAIAFFDEALEISESLGDQQAALQALSNKAAALIGADHLEAAETLIAEAGKRTTVAYLPLQINLGILLIKKRFYSRAQTVLEETLAAADKHDGACRAKIYFALGRLKHAQGNPAGAIEYFQQALESDRATGFYKGTARTHALLGDIYRELDSPDKALAHYKRAVKIYALILNESAVKEVLAKLEQVASATRADIRLTTHFVKNWLEDKSLKRPCR